MWLGGRVLLFSPLNLRLDGIKGFRRNDGFVCVRRVIPGQLSLVLPGDFGQMILPEFGLEQEISGIGIVAENSFHGTLVEHVAALGGVCSILCSMEKEEIYKMIDSMYER